MISTGVQIAGAFVLVFILLPLYVKQLGRFFGAGIYSYFLEQDNKQK